MSRLRPRVGRQRQRSTWSAAEACKGSDQQTKFDVLKASMSHTSHPTETAIVCPACRSLHVGQLSMLSAQDPTFEFFMCDDCDYAWKAQKQSPPTLQEREPATKA